VSPEGLEVGFSRVECRHLFCRRSSRPLIVTSRCAATEGLRRNNEPPSAVSVPRRLYPKVVSLDPGWRGDRSDLVEL
jgi:hypothetical protein